MVGKMVWWHGGVAAWWDGVMTWRRRGGMVGHGCGGARLWALGARFWWWVAESLRLTPHLKEVNVERVSELLRLLRRHLTGALQIRLVTHEQFVHIFTRVPGVRWNQGGTGQGRARRARRGDVSLAVPCRCGSACPTFPAPSHPLERAGRTPTPRDR